jgi:hypothetical protein
MPAARNMDHNSRAIGRRAVVCCPPRLSREKQGPAQLQIGCGLLALQPGDPPGIETIEFAALWIDAVRDDG